MSTNLHFEKFAQDAHEYVNQLATDLGHPEEKERTLIIWRAVMHSIPDRIDLGESFQIIAPLPIIFKGIYVEDWKYSEKPPKDFDTIDEMKAEVKAIQKQYGEDEFNWSKPTEEIISTTIDSLKRFMSEGQLNHLKGQMPKEIKEVIV